MLLTSVVSALALPLVALANPHGGGMHARHAEIAKRAAGHVDLYKRFEGSRWTFYDVGLGACGQNNVASDFIVALNSAQYGGGYPGPNCFKKIVMTYNGKTATATIMDECPGCPYGGLDLSRGLFSYFASESVGVLSGTWSFSSGGGGSQPSPTTSKPRPTTTWSPPIISVTVKPATTWTPEPTTTKKPTPSSTTSSKASSTKASSSSASSSSSVAIVPTTSAGPSNLQLFNNVLLNLGGIAVAGAAGNA